MPIMIVCSCCKLLCSNVHWELISYKHLQHILIHMARKVEVTAATAFPVRRNLCWMEYSVIASLYFCCCSQYCHNIGAPPPLLPRRNAILYDVHQLVVIRTRISVCVVSVPCAAPALFSPSFLVFHSYRPKVFVARFRESTKVFARARDEPSCSRTYPFRLTFTSSGVDTW